MNRKIKYPLILCGFLIVVEFNNCGQVGFDPSKEVITGNPLTQQMAAQNIGYALCQVVSSCAPSSSPVSTGDCYTNMQPITNVVAALGASPTTYPTFGALINANLTGTILGNTAVTTSSVNQILGESCSSSVVQNVFASGQPNYTNVAAMVPVSSAAIFAPATQIYRSVGPGNISPLATGTGNAMTISASVATFASAVPNNVGVGDVIIYAPVTLGTSDSIAFIAGRIDSTHYTVQSSSGGAPAGYSANTVWQIYRAYTSIDSSLTGYHSENSAIVTIDSTIGYFDGGWNANNNIQLSNSQWNIAVYGDAADTTGAGSETYNWNTSQKNFVKIYAPYLSTEVGASQRHQGVWDNTKARQIVSNRMNFNTGGWIWFDGLQLENNENSSINYQNGFYQAPNINGIGCWISNNLIVFNITGNDSYYGIRINGSGNATNYVWNNIVSMNSAANSTGINLQTGTNYVYNNTVVNAMWAISATSNVADAVVKNNIAQGCSGTQCYLSTPNPWDATSTNNLASDNSAPGLNPQNNKTVTFMNAATGDYLLSPTDTAANGAGVDLSADSFLPFTNDIQGLTRTDPWSIGASNP